MRAFAEHTGRITANIGGGILIMLSAMVAIPLTIKTYQESGGPWGFGIIGLSILMPLSLYLFFGIAGLTRNEKRQRKIFVATHMATFATGLVTLIIFPVYPTLLVAIPLMLAAIGIWSRSRYRYYLLLMIFLGIAANIVLLKWELDFNRAIPIIQLFENPEPGGFGY